VRKVVTLLIKKVLLHSCLVGWLAHVRINCGPEQGQQTTASSLLPPDVFMQLRFGDVAADTSQSNMASIIFQC